MGCDTDERRIREEINFITSPPYILARNIFHVLRRFDEAHRRPSLRGQYK
jgi:hypothetical protein